MAGTAVRGRLTWQVATVTSVIRETGSVRTIEGGASKVGQMLLLPRRNRATHRVYSLKTFPIVEPPAGYTQIYRNASWRAFAAPVCAA